MPFRSPRARVRALLLTAVAAVAVAGYVVLDDAPRRESPPTGPSIVPVGDLQPEPEPASKPGEPEATLRDETPDEVPADVLDAGRRATDRIGEQLEPRPTGGAQNYSCREDFSGHVYSSYSIKPTELVLHYTVSPNRQGWGDVLGIQAYFERTRVASADRIIDFEGHCLQMVPITTGKAWTQGAANNATCASYEIIATGRETRAEWLASPLFRKRILASIAADDMRRCGIPFRRVDPVGCTFPAGWTDHNALECGNDHTDVTPNFPYDVFAAQLADGPDAPNRKLRRWERSHRIAHAKQRRGCTQHPDPPACRAHYRARSERLHRLIAREKARR